MSCFRCIRPHRDLGHVQGRNGLGPRQTVHAGAVLSSSYDARGRLVPRFPGARSLQQLGDAARYIHHLGALGALSVGVLSIRHDGEGEGEVMVEMVIVMVMAKWVVVGMVMVMNGGVACGNDAL